MSKMGMRPLAQRVHRCRTAVVGVRAASESLLSSASVLISKAQSRPRHGVLVAPLRWDRKLLQTLAQLVSQFSIIWNCMPPSLDFSSRFCSAACSFSNSTMSSTTLSPASSFSHSTNVFRVSYAEELEAKRELVSGP